MPLLKTVLQAVAGEPLTPAELAGRLGSTPQALEGMLLTLERSGYVQAAQPQSGDCQCGPCALKSLCRNADDEDAGTPLPLLRLTPRGERYLARP
ncbi:FeoC-like transcriptional regulator [Deinococcus sp. Marseille-Q6407]|uniref:DprA-like winged helix domain-containing protein n=1 Tax=Deinococcus sp. Marseille-Q6407 TaxID=2969223 RepID=UPI0021C1B82E|nr:FeoC-like transcriptional regulator [Deinococcus sp. Marseille-Q6407]